MRLRDWPGHCSCGTKLSPERASCVEAELTTKKKRENASNGVLLGSPTYLRKLYDGSSNVPAAMSQLTHRKLGMSETMRRFNPKSGKKCSNASG